MERKRGSMENNYLIIRSDASVIDIVTFLAFGLNAGKVLDTSMAQPLTSTAAFLLNPDRNSTFRLNLKQRWIISLSYILCRILGFFRKPLALCGLILEFFLNFWCVNGGGLFELIANVFTGNIVVPERDSEKYFSSIGYIDKRLDLYKSQYQSSQEGIHELKRVDQKFEGRALMDLCIMASKLVYENANVVQNIVTEHKNIGRWILSDSTIVGTESTQVFILCDKAEDADLILITFRGTEPFNAGDWCTDMDYSMYGVPKIGLVHMGFLEALGFGSRDQISNVRYHLQNPAPCSGIDTAYYSVRSKLRSLLTKHKNAKFVVTGHSLGAALAVLFPAILLSHDETELMERLLAVYTFGQPRIGDEELERCMHSHLCSPVEKYFRVVYCNDIVPRVPFDDKVFLYKHFGTCVYYNSFFSEKCMDEQPNRNFFGIRYLVSKYLIAVWELIRGFGMAYMYGEEYKETKLSIFFRVLGLVIPGISAHLPNNYVNCVRLGNYDGTMKNKIE